RVAPVRPAPSLMLRETGHGGSYQLRWAGMFTRKALLPRVGCEARSGSMGGSATQRRLWTACFASSADRVTLRFCYEAGHAAMAFNVDSQPRGMNASWSPLADPEASGGRVKT